MQLHAYALQPHIQRGERREERSADTPAAAVCLDCLGWSLRRLSGCGPHELAGRFGGGANLHAPRRRRGRGGRGRGRQIRSHAVPSANERRGRDSDTTRRSIRPAARRREGERYGRAASRRSAPPRFLPRVCTAMLASAASAIGPDRIDSTRPDSTRPRVAACSLRAPRSHDPGCLLPPPAQTVCPLRFIPAPFPPSPPPPWRPSLA